MAEIPITKKSSLPWLWIIIASLIIGLLAWWLLTDDDDDEVDIDTVPPTTEVQSIEKAPHTAAISTPGILLFRSA